MVLLVLHWLLPGITLLLREDVVHVEDEEVL
jgi:hypothetical protein